MATPKITKRMLHAIQTYYFHCLHAREYRTPWDKEADLDAIAAAARAAHWYFEAAAGSMWFSYATQRTRVTWNTSMQRFPNFTREGEKRVSKTNHP